MHVHVDTTDLLPRERVGEREKVSARNDTMAARTNITLIQQSRRLSALTDTVLDISTVCGDCFKRNTQEFLRAGYRSSPQGGEERRRREREREMEGEITTWSVWVLALVLFLGVSVPPLCPSAGVWAETGLVPIYRDSGWLPP